jgi:hypothetical protein
VRVEAWFAVAAVFSSVPPDSSGQAGRFARARPSAEMSKRYLSFLVLVAAKK